MLKRLIFNMWKAHVNLMKNSKTSRVSAKEIYKKNITQKKGRNTSNQQNNLHSKNS